MTQGLFSFPTLAYGRGAMPRGIRSFMSAGSGIYVRPPWCRRVFLVAVGGGQSGASGVGTNGAAGRRLAATADIAHEGNIPYAVGAGGPTGNFNVGGPTTFGTNGRYIQAPGGGQSLPVLGNLVFNDLDNRFTNASGSFPFPFEISGGYGNAGAGNIGGAGFPGIFGCLYIWEYD